jgi:WD40 repeat protein
MILAGGAGKNEFRIFDYESGNIVCIINDMERSVMSMDINRKSNGFAFGSGDSTVRIFDI